MFQSETQQVYKININHMFAVFASSCTFFTVRMHSGICMHIFCRDELQRPHCDVTVFLNNGIFNGESYQVTLVVFFHVGELCISKGSLFSLRKPAAMSRLRGPGRHMPQCRSPTVPTWGWTPYRWDGCLVDAVPNRPHPSPPTWVALGLPRYCYG